MTRAIHITDNALIPLKERVVDHCYDPRRWLWRKLTGRWRPRVYFSRPAQLRSPVLGSFQAS